jgi:hypothetical protein
MAAGGPILFFLPNRPAFDIQREYSRLFDVPPLRDIKSLRQPAPIAGALEIREAERGDKCGLRTMRTLPPWWPARDDQTHPRRFSNAEMALCSVRLRV